MKIFSSYFSNTSSIGNSFFILWKYFKQILYYGQWQQIFSLAETIFFHSYFSFKTIIAIRGRLLFKKSYFCWWKPFSSIFQTLIQMEAVFRSSEIVFFNESFIVAIVNGFSFNYKPSAFIQSFFCWWIPFLKLTL